MLHGIILIWGFTGVLGKLISVSSDMLVGYRMLIAVISIGLFVSFSTYNFRIDRKSLIRYLLVGFVIAGHWITFFESIKVSTVSIALSCMATASLFTAFLEPLFFKRKINLIEIVLGAVVVVGLYLIFEFETAYAYGIVLALISAFLAALFTVLNGKLIKKGSAVKISFYEMLGGVIMIALYFLLTQNFESTDFLLSYSDLFYLILLGVVCTAFAFVVSVYVMKELSPFTVTMSVNMEPLYAILLALVFFGDDELMSPGFYLGATIVFLTVLGNAYIKLLQKRRLKKQEKMMM